ncbi:MAG: (2Fe-2S) ferredoxin domain-containing protein [Cytophagales bacterium]|nr:(2Fe-2S) ferredoxin domain-containing protein [Cytophagales bacterium]
MGKDLTKVNQTIFICNGGSCKKQQAEDLTREIRCELKMAGLHEATHTIKTLCMGQCENAPVMYTEADNAWYKQMSIDRINRMVDHLASGNGDASDNILYRREWDKMKPVREITPKTKSEFKLIDDAEYGQIECIKIYPWEFNTYPLIKECLNGKWKGFHVKCVHRELYPGYCQIKYDGGKVQVACAKSESSVVFVLRAPADSSDFKYKINNVRLFKTVRGDLSGLQLFNQAEGKILEATWADNDILWQHLVDNYARISS